MTKTNAITPDQLHQYVEQINKLLPERERLALDGSRDRGGARVWRIGRTEQEYREMGGPDLTTTQMYYLLNGYHSRVCGEMQIMGHWATPNLTSTEQDGPSVRYYRAYALNTEQVLMYDAEGHWLVENTDLAPGSYHIFEVRSGATGEFITSYRDAAPFEVDESMADDAEVRDLKIPQLMTEDSGIFYPQPDPTFVLNPEQEAIFDHIFALSQYKPEKLLISGPPGTGKTEGAREYAARRGYGVFIISCGQMESPAEWFGSRHVVVDEQSGEAITGFNRSAFIRALETPNTLIILDEFNRLHSSLQNSLYNLFDDIGMAWVDHELKRYVRLASGVVIIATANIGAQHTGTFVIDSAMADRFSYHLRTDYLTPSYEAQVLVQRTGVHEDIARRLVEVAGKVREIASDPDSDSPITEGISFRQLLKASEAIAHGMLPARAAAFTIFPKFSDEGGEESPQASVREIFQGKFGGE